MGAGWTPSASSAASAGAGPQDSPSVQAVGSPLLWTESPAETDGEERGSGLNVEDDLCVCLVEELISVVTSLLMVTLKSCLSTMLQVYLFPSGLTHMALCAFDTLLYCT